MPHTKKKRFLTLSCKIEATDDALDVDDDDDDDTDEAADIVEQSDFDDNAGDVSDVVVENISSSFINPITKLMS